jgi:hypothetical protein
MTIGLNILCECFAIVRTLKPVFTILLCDFHRSELKRNGALNKAELKM